MCKTLKLFVCWMRFGCDLVHPSGFPKLFRSAATKVALEKPDHSSQGERQVPRVTLLPLVTLAEKVQNLLGLFAGRFSLAFHPSCECLLRNSQGLGNFGALLDDNIPVIS